MNNKARIRTNGIAGLVFWDERPGFDKTAVIAPGLPYAPTVETIAPLLTATGYGVVQPQYHGSFDSDGSFTPIGCIQSLRDVESIIFSNAELRDLRGDRQFAIGNSVDLIAAHSFGTYAAIGAILRGMDTKLAVMFSPMFEYGIRSFDVGLKVDLRKHVSHIAAALPLTFRMESESDWRHFFLEESEFHPRSVPARSERVKVLCVVGDSDPSIDVDRSRRYIESFARSYESSLEFLEYKIVKKGNHSIETLLTDEVKELILSEI